MPARQEQGEAALSLPPLGGRSVPLDPLPLEPTVARVDGAKEL
jgi:hypothetical protein